MKRAGTIVLIILVLAFGLIVALRTPQSSSVTIVLTPSVTDALLSVGGIMADAKGEQIVVATFFNASNAESLRQFGAEHKTFIYTEKDLQDVEVTQAEISKDIQALVSSHSAKKVKVYGPATFPEAMGSAQARILHAAYIDVAKTFPTENATIGFYVYEDFPLVEEFAGTVPASLQTYLEEVHDTVFDRVAVRLERYAAARKAAALDIVDVTLQDRSEDFTASRCREYAACEVVYKLLRI